MLPVTIRGIDIAAIEVVPGYPNICRGAKAAGNHLTPDIVKSVVIDPHQVGSCNCNSIAGKYHAFKTVIGIGSTATIKGKGLRLNGVSNVVIRNLTISDINV